MSRKLPDMLVETFGDAPNRFKTVTPSDTNTLPKTMNCLILGTTTLGTVVVDFWNDQTYTFDAGTLATGMQHVMSVKRIKAASTAVPIIIGYIEEGPTEQ